MNRNIEIKARLDNIDEARNLAVKISDSPVERIHQADTFFHCPKGRLKLRMFSDDRGELIFYERDDVTGPEMSRYSRSETSDPKGMIELLARCVGVRGEVIKVRDLYIVGNTRIHIDEVEGLGNFLEIEVVLRPDESHEQGDAIARDLLNRLSIDESQLVECAYIDLIMRLFKGENPRGFPDYSRRTK